jgi:hypothetical protein
MLKQFLLDRIQQRKTGAGPKTKSVEYGNEK